MKRLVALRPVIAPLLMVFWMIRVRLMARRKAPGLRRGKNFSGTSSTQAVRKFRNACRAPRMNPLSALRRQ